MWGLILLTGGTGCSGMNNTEKGLLGGGLVGPGIGALAGRGNPAAMAIGGIGGAAVGGLFGAGQDRREEHKAAVARADAIATAQSARQMSIHEVVQLSQTQTHEQIIINQIESTGSNFNLTTNDLSYLQQQGVSPRVITVMQARRYARPVVVHERPVYVVPGPPPPPVYVEPGVSVGIRGRF
jgi:type II secretory pathway pseudopilin PulG